MAENIHKLAFSIQGAIDSSFVSSVGEANGYLKNLEDRVKSVSEAKKHKMSINKEFIETSRAAAELESKIASLTSTQRRVDGYIAQRKSAVEVASAYRNAKKELKALTAAYETDKTKENKNAMQAAAKAASVLEKAYLKNKTALEKTKIRLAEAGVNTKKLSSENKRLAGDIATADKELGKLSASLGKYAGGKYHLDKMRALTKQAWRDLKFAAKAWAGFLAVGGYAGKKLYNLTSSVAEAGDKAVKTAKKLGMTTEGFQKMQYAAKLSGVEDFSGKVTKMNAVVAQAVKGQGAAVKGIKELGISAKQLQKMGPEKSILVLADKLNAIKDPARRARIELALFGKSGADMKVFLSGGSKGIRELMTEAQKTGMVIPENAARMAEAFKDARDYMGASLKGLGNIIGIELMETFTETFRGIGDFLQNNQGTIKDFAKNLGDGFRELLPYALAFAKGIGAVAKTVRNATRSLAKLMGGAKNFGIIIGLLPFAKFAFTVGRLGAHFFALSQTIWGVKGAIFILGKALLTNPIFLFLGLIAGAAYFIYKNWKRIKAFFINLWNSVSEGVASARDAIAGAFATLPDWLQGALSMVGNNILFPFKLGYQLVKATIGYFRGDFESVPEALASAFKGIKSIITEPFEKAFAWVSDKWEGVKAMFGGGPRAAAPSISMRRHARGGVISSPAFSSLAERGPEVVVPYGQADRGLGLSALSKAARGLGVDVLPNKEDGLASVFAALEKLEMGLTSRHNENIKQTLSDYARGKERAGGMRQGSERFGSNPIKIEFNNLSITGGGDGRDLAQSFMAEVERRFPYLMAQWQERVARTSYGTA